MHRITLFKKYLLPTVAIAVFCVGLYMVASPHVRSIKENVLSSTLDVLKDDGEKLPPEKIQALSVRESSDYWRERISAVGGERAYEEFHVAYANFDPSDQHTQAHIFGGELYHGEGVDGFSVCDLQYSYGCYHEFLGQAIFEEGMPVVEKLNQGCYDDLKASGQELSCQHGIGHGILAAIGYETETLPKALESCKGLPYNDPIGGCYGGVFMEYNLRTMLSLDGVPVREKEVSDLHEPCKSVPEYAKEACYYWHPQWWLTVLGGEGYGTRLERHARMGELCDELGPGKLRDTCVKGIGNNLVTTGITSGEAVRLCKAATSDLRTEVLCRSDAANSFFVVPGLSDEAAGLCEGLEGEYYEYCYAHSINQLNILNQGNI